MLTGRIAKFADVLRASNKLIERKEDASEMRKAIAFRFVRAILLPYTYTQQRANFSISDDCDEAAGSVSSRPGTDRTYFPKLINYDDSALAGVANAQKKLANL